MPCAHQEIANLLYRYAELMDRGELDAVAALFAHATYGAGEAAPVRGAAAVGRINRTLVRIYEDGTPKTQHVTTNALIEVDETAGTATARSRFTVFQALEPGGPILPITMGRYHDRFERVEGRWRFADRRIWMDFAGDLSRHLRLDELERMTRLAGGDAAPAPGPKPA